MSSFVESEEKEEEEIHHELCTFESARLSHFLVAAAVVDDDGTSYRES